ncbi:unnamed protein product [Pylaiella littoralis]
MEALLLYGCMTWVPRAHHYELLRATHDRLLLLRVIGYHREQGTYQPLSYAKALEKTGRQCVEAIIRQRRLLFAGALARQDDGWLPKRLMFGELVGGEDPGRGRPAQNWLKSLEDDFKAFGATDGSTDDRRLTFGIDTALWTTAAKENKGVPWYAGMVNGAAQFMTASHKEEKEASRKRAGKRTERELSTTSTERTERRRRGRGKLEEARFERPGRMRRRRQRRARGN